MSSCCLHRYCKVPKVVCLHCAQHVMHAQKHVLAARTGLLPARACGKLAAQAVHVQCSALNAVKRLRACVLERGVLPGAVALSISLSMALWCMGGGVRCVGSSSASSRHLQHFAAMDLPRSAALPYCHCDCACCLPAAAMHACACHKQACLCLWHKHGCVRQTHACLWQSRW
jgi:hypothetical protein